MRLDGIRAEVDTAFIALNKMAFEKLALPKFDVFQDGVALRSVRIP